MAVAPSEWISAAMCSSRQPAPISARSSGSCSRRCTRGGSGGSQMRGRNVPPSPAMRTPAISVTLPCSAPWVVRGLRCGSTRLAHISGPPSLSWLPKIQCTSMPRSSSGAASSSSGRSHWMSPSRMAALRQGIERCESALDKLPLLVDVADEDNRHCVLRSVTSEPDLDDVPAASLAFHEYPQMETG